MKKSLLYLGLFLLALKVTSQELPNLTPPSPTSYELTKYGDIEINESTGIANFDIPLFNFISGQLSLPISLNCSTSGVKVDQISSWVGMGWNLESGGLITREVRGIADEHSQRVFTSYTSVLDILNYNTSDFVDFGLDLVGGNSDYEPDIYTFNISGLRGSFYLDMNNNPIFLKKEVEFKVQKSANGFIIYTNTGIEYHFNGVGETSKAIIQSSPSITHDPTPTVQTTWFLTKIKNYLGDEINLFYDFQTNYVYSTGFSETYIAVTPNLDRGNSVSYNVYKNLLFSKKISKITSNRNNSEIHFNASQSRTDLPSEYKLNSIELKLNNLLIKKYNFYYDFVSSNKQYYGPINGNLFNIPEHYKRMFLMKINETDKNGIEINGNEHSFEYDDSQALPPRMSFSQDLLGYYNGTQNHGYLPDDVDEVNMFSTIGMIKGNRKANFEFAKKGVLKKIIYPTKGFTEIEYEPAIVLETKNSKVQTNFNMNVNNNNNNNIYTQDFTSPYFQKINLYADMTVLNGGIDYVHNKVNIIVRNKNTNEIVLNSGLSQSYGSNFSLAYLDFWVQENQTYEVKITFVAIFDEIESSLNFNYASGEVPITSPVNKSGVRVKRILSKESLSSSPIIKRYFYSEKEQINNLETFNELTAFNFIENEGERPSGFIDPSSGNGSSNSSYTLYSFKSTSLTNFALTLPESFMYKVVTTSFGDNFENGGIEKHFELNLSPSNSVIYNNPIPNSTNSNFVNLSNGRLMKEVIFNINEGQINTLQEKKQYYIDIDTYIDNFIGRHRFTPQGLDMPLIRLLEGIDIERYRLYSRWTSLDSTVTKTFLNNKITITSEKNIYTSNFAGFPNEKITHNSEGDTFLTKTLYASDLNDITLISQNRGLDVLETETHKNNIRLNKQKTIYSNFATNYLPEKIQTSKGTQALEDRIIYHSYDSKGNPQEVSKKDGTKIYYVWGYNQTQPIAKIEGFTDAQLANVQSLIAAAVTASNNDNDTCKDSFPSTCNESGLRTALNTLRNNSNLANAQVTSFTYDPLVGVTSITDPRRQIIYYEYDNLNRLKQVVDKDGNILSKNEYHYKNN